MTLRPLALALAALAVCAATPATAQQAAPPPPVLIPVAPVPDEQAMARYMSDFDQLCLATGGERAAVRAAVAEAGWTEGATDGFQGGPAVDVAVWDAPDGRGAQLLTSASAPGELDGGLVVRTCIVQAAGGSAGPRDRVVQGVSRLLGFSGIPNATGVTWIMSGSGETGWRNEMVAFVGAGTPDAAFALALESPLFLLTLVGAPNQSGLALMRVSREPAAE